MAEYAFDLGAVATVPILGDGRVFPVRNVYGVTRNYYPAGPGGEVRARAERPAPAIFTKSARWVLAPGGAIPYPPATGRLEPEIEMVIAIGATARAVGAADADKVIFGYCVGLDMTRRDLQVDARGRRDPLDIAKWFEGATPLSAIARASDIGHPAAGAITLDVNGARAQSGDLGDMIWTPAEIVVLLSRYFPLEPGDVIFSGTPPGEIALGPGDRLSGRIAGVGSLDVAIAAAR